MRIGVAGKGGAGKTTISATLARLLARAGRSVLAIDADSNPNLAIALGAEPPELPFRGDIVSRRLDGPALRVPLDQVLDRHSTRGPDGVRVALMGAASHAHEGCLCSAHATVSAVLDQLGERGDVATILDLEASPEHFSRGTARYVDTLLLVTEPYYRSLETTRRMASLAGELPVPRIAVVANKVRSREDGDAIAEFCDRHGLRLLATVPWSDAVLDADRARVPFLDGAPDTDVARTALQELAEGLFAPEPASPV